LTCYEGSYLKIKAGSLLPNTNYEFSCWASHNGDEAVTSVNVTVVEAPHGGSISVTSNSNGDSWYETTYRLSLDGWTGIGYVQYQFALLRDSKRYALSEFSSSNYIDLTLPGTGLLLIEGTIQDEIGKL
jgi:hypothetical protein